MWLCSVSSPGVLQGFELRLSTETEILWMTSCLTAAPERWAVGYFMYATLPRRQPPRPSPSLKWSRMRWRVASLCRGNRKPNRMNPAVTTSASMSLWSLFLFRSGLNLAATCLSNYVLSNLNKDGGQVSTLKVKPIISIQDFSVYKDSHCEKRFSFKNISLEHNETSKPSFK